ncbi:hypothetical protein Agub_g6493 [Astrephomene gubernaculifera]|uniref:BTB domain-containing protein n=1 Tax=Astrephomene gubernaculifera TaxID=47775 RepID=A0AAD3DNI4_9CHLO|nr:hypothetical protein Agub_g6493 [Astrephomene gubernaculifera]
MSGQKRAREDDTLDHNIDAGQPRMGTHQGTQTIIALGDPADAPEADLILRLQGGEELPVHSYLLRLASPVLRVVLSAVVAPGTDVQNGRRELNLPDDSLAAWRLLWQAISPDAKDVFSEDAWCLMQLVDQLPALRGLLSLAHKYGIERVVQQTCDFGLCCVEKAIWRGAEKLGADCILVRKLVTRSHGLSGVAAAAAAGEPRGGGRAGGGGAAAGARAGYRAGGAGGGGARRRRGWDEVEYGSGREREYGMFLRQTELQQAMLWLDMLQRFDLHWEYVNMYDLIMTHGGVGHSDVAAAVDALRRQRPPTVLHSNVLSDLLLSCLPPQARCRRRRAGSRRNRHWWPADFGGHGDGPSSSDDDDRGAEVEEELVDSDSDAAMHEHDMEMDAELNGWLIGDEDGEDVPLLQQQLLEQEQEGSSSGSSSGEESDSSEDEEAEEEDNGQPAMHAFGHAGGADSSDADSGDDDSSGSGSSGDEDDGDEEDGSTSSSGSGSDWSDDEDEDD